MYCVPSSSVNAHGSRIVVLGTSELPRDAGSRGTVRGDTQGPAGEELFTTATCQSTKGVHTSVRRRWLLLLSGFLL